MTNPVRMPPPTADTGVGDGHLINLNTFDVIVGYARPGYVVVTGFIAGVLLWVPLVALFYFNKLISMGAPKVGTYGNQWSLGFAEALPYVIGTGLLGLLLGWLRRASARREWYTEIASLRLGLNGVVATVGGALVCIVLIASGSQVGLLLMFLAVGVLFGGFIVNALWESIHNRLLRPYARRHGDELLEGAIRHTLQRHDELRPKRLDDVKVANGKVTLRGVWEDGDARHEVQRVIRTLGGVALVQFEKADD